MECDSYNILAFCTNHSDFDEAEKRLIESQISYSLKKTFDIKDFVSELSSNSFEIAIICCNSITPEIKSLIKSQLNFTKQIPLILITHRENNEDAELNALIYDYFNNKALLRFPKSVKNACKQFVENKTDEIPNKNISHGQYKALIEQMHEGFLVVDNNDVILFANKKFCEMLDYTEHELIGRIGYTFLIPKEMQHIIIENNIKRLNNISEEYEIEMLKKSGERINILMNAGPVKNETGKVIGSMSTCLDITKKKAIEQALKESEEKFRKAFITSPDSININRLNDGVFISINNGFTQITGYTEEDVIGKSSLDVGIWINASERQKMVDSLKENKIVQNLEFTFQKKSGELLSGLLSAALIQLNNDLCILSITRDITEKKKTEIALLESERIFSEFMEHSPVYVYFKDKETRSLRLSRNFEQMLGKPLESILNKTMDEIFPSEFAKKMVSDDLKVMSEGRQVNIEETLNGRDYNTIKFPINIDGQPTYLAGFTIDITEKKLIESSLRESERRLATLIANLPGISYRCKNDRNWTMEFVSEGCKELTGYDSGDFINNKNISYNQIIHSDFKEIIWKKWQEVLQKKEKFQAEYQIITSNNETKWVWEQGQGVYNNNGNIVALEGFITDITLQKNVEEQLIVALKKAEESDRLKSAFLANMSHEIRTPMNGILGFSELLNDPDISDIQRKKYIGIVNKCSLQLLEIINNVIDISKIESGQETVSLKNFNLNSLFDELFQFFEPLAQQQNINLYLKSNLSQEQAELFSDPVKLKQTFVNLIGNALKFTDKGSITLSAEMVENKIICKVEDTGIGIRKEMQSIIFERFRQGEPHKNNKAGGTGLGLPISKSYIEMLGGTLTVESTQNNGSSFIITLPSNNKKNATLNSAEPKPKSIQLDLSGKTILIAEDEEINIRLLQSALKNTKAKFLLAKNGKEAVDIAMQSPDISLILMDIKMPEMNGIEATQAIKKAKPNIPIIALTAFAFTNDKEKSIAAGCCDYLIKPILLNKLYEAIQKHIA